MNAARDILAGLLAVLAAALLALWAPSQWIQQNVVEEKGFLAIAGPLGSDPEFQRAVSDAGVEAALDQLEVPRWLRGRVAPMIQDQAAVLTGNKAFETIWADTIRSLHTTLFTPGGGTVQADLNPYVDELVAPVGDLIGTTIDIPDGEALRLDIVTIPDSPWPGRIQAFGGASAWSGWAGIGCAVLSLLLAARRGVMAAVLGLAIGLGGLALLLGAQSLGLFIPAAVDGTPIVGTLVRAFEQRLAADMVGPAMALIGVGAAILVAAVLALGIIRNRRLPEGEDVASVRAAR